jgi:hypothetical protein
MVTPSAVSCIENYPSHNQVQNLLTLRQKARDPQVSKPCRLIPQPIGNNAAKDDQIWAQACHLNFRCCYAEITATDAI